MLYDHGVGRSHSSTVYDVVTGTSTLEGRRIKWPLKRPKVKAIYC